MKIHKNKILNSRSMLMLVAAAAFAMMPACSNKEGHQHAEHEVHDEHDGHDHEHEGHDHDEHEGHDHEHEGHDHEHEGHEGISGSNAIHFSKEMASKTGLVVETAVVRPFGEIIHGSGRIQPSSGNQRQVVARAAGIVTFVPAHLAAGKEVAAGQALFRINTDATADQSLQVMKVEAESNYRTSKSAYERGEQLAREGLMTQSELLQLKNAYERAEAVWRHVSSVGGANASAVASPIHGFVTSLDVSNGQFVQAGQTLATVATNRDLNVLLELPAAKARRIAGIESASIRPLNSQEIYRTAPGNALVSIGQGVKEGTNRVPVILKVPNHADLIPGEFVNVDIRTSGGPDALTVPTEGVMEQQGVWFVFVQKGPESYEKRIVRPGRSDATTTEILSGLKPGEKVVGHGAVMVKLAQASGSLDPHAGHMH